MGSNAVIDMFKEAMSLNPSDTATVFNINKCYVCVLTVRETKLKRCGGCFKISYCGQAHQKLHWNEHKEYCKIIQKVEKALPEGDLADVENWNNYRKQMSTICKQEYEIKMKRRIDSNELGMVFYPGRCEICRSKNGRVVCLKCISVNYCSKEHMDLDSKYHSTLCQDFKFMTDRHMYYKKYSPSDLSLRKGTITLCENMREFIESNMQPSAVSPDLRDLEMSEISTRITYSLSLLWGLKCLNYKVQDKLVIHLVGSAQGETFQLFQWELIPHMYPNIRKLNIVFIGPEVIPPILRKICKTCRKIINFETSNDFYHDYVASNKYQKPNIVCAFNCGFYRYYSLWQPSLRFLIEGEVFIMSSFVDYEADQDMKFILDIKPDLTVQKKRNPFSCLSPLQRSWNDVLSYMNKIVTVFSHKP